MFKYTISIESRSFLNMLNWIHIPNKRLYHISVINFILAHIFIRCFEKIKLSAYKLIVLLCVQPTNPFAHSFLGTAVTKRNA